MDQKEMKTPKSLREFDPQSVIIIITLTLNLGLLGDKNNQQQQLQMTSDVTSVAVEYKS